MKKEGDIIMGFFTELNEAFNDDNDHNQEQATNRSEAQTLAFNAIDQQHEALSKLEYMIMSHHAYLKAISADLGEMSHEVEGYYFAHRSVLDELKEACKTIEQGLRS